VRIVQLVENLEVGGLERLDGDLAIAQKQSGHQAIVYCLHDSGPLAETLEEASIPVVAFRKAAGFSMGTILAMARSLRGHQVDVIHGHNPGVHPYALSARIARVPVCVNTRHSALTSKDVPYQERYFRGRTNDSPGALAGLDVFVLSSVNEGLPLVILEALAAGLLVVSTNVGGIPEVLPKESSWLCPPGDAAALAAAMLQAAACGDLRERGAISRRIASDQMVRHYEAPYRRLLPAAPTAKSQ